MEMKETLEEVSVSSPVQLDTTEAEAMVLAEEEQAAVQEAMGPRRTAQIQIPDDVVSDALTSNVKTVKGSKTYQTRPAAKAERKKRRKVQAKSRKANRHVRKVNRDR